MPHELHQRRQTDAATEHVGCEKVPMNRVLGGERLPLRYGSTHVPDGAGVVTNVKRTGSTVEFTLDRLDVYAVVVFGS